MPLHAFESLPQEKKERILFAGIKAFSCRSYRDVRTEAVTESCRISKGILFHYFGSKKEFYLYCLEMSLIRLTGDADSPDGSDFYDILFACMHRKIKLCRDYPDETHLVNMASRDPSEEISYERSALLQKYAAIIHAESSETVRKAVSALPLRKEERNHFVLQGLELYIRAVINRYLTLYLETPDAFFADSGRIMEEMREYLDLMLYGICEKEVL